MRFFRPSFVFLFALAQSIAMAGGEFNIRDYGAKGDGTTLDSPAINAAVEAASAAGGGTVRLPAGRYLSFSVRLKSNLTLQFDPGAVLVAADPASGAGTYDTAEPNEWDQYQDFGHSHWQNSLIWGIDLENVTIVGAGLIDGTKGLTRRGPPPRRAGDANAASTGEPAGATTGNPPTRRSMDGLGNKAISLKNCRNVTLRDFSMINVGHMALLATGVDHLTIDNLKVDTNRDGFDIDVCRNVRIANCSVNTPNDDAIVLKSSFALGTARPTENVTIVNCFVSGFDVGTLLDSTFKRTQERAPDRDGPTGRIKLGTESNGGFRNITISNCIFDRSRGLALETVDGGTIEDVTVSNLVMRDVCTSPIFIRLGNRARGPTDIPAGAIRRIHISQITVNGCDARYPVLLAGLPSHVIEDVTLSDIHILSQGGLTMDLIAQQPAERINSFFLRNAEPGATGPRDPFAVPERETAYPEPSMFGLLPASGVYARHVRNIVVRDFTLNLVSPDNRPAVVLDDAAGMTFENFRVAREAGIPTFVLRNVRDFEAHRCASVPDTRHEKTDDVSF